MKNQKGFVRLAVGNGVMEVYAEAWTYVWVHSAKLVGALAGYKSVSLMCMLEGWRWPGQNPEAGRLGQKPP